jgi:hypothetical protein
MSEEKLEGIPLPGTAEVAETPVPAAKPDPLASHKAAFDKLISERKTEPSKQYATVDKPKKAEAVKAAEPEPAEAEGAEETKPEPKKPAELTGLRQRLVLAGNPRKAVESLSDTEVDEWWTKQEQRERSAATAIQRTAELEKKLAENTKSSEPPEVPTDDLDLEEIASKLSSQFGEDEGKALADVLQSLIAPLQQENKAIKELIETARKRGQEEISDRNRKRLAKLLPAVKENADVWSSIQRRAQEEWQKDPQKFSTAEEAYDDSFQKLYGALLPQEPSPAAVPDNAKEKARIAASAVTAPNSQKRERVYTPIDAHRAAFNALLKNENDVAGAQRAFTKTLTPQ